MTVAIDPSEVRRQATVEAAVKRRGLRLPVRTLLLGGLGGAGLLAFTIGAFSFFGGLADPRARTIRPTAVVSKMPDLKDGLPALVTDTASAPAATVLNLPKPPAAETAPAKAETGSSNNLQAAAAPPLAEATGSVAQRKAAPIAAPVRTKPTPTIENAATVSGDAKPVSLIAPARTAGPLAPARTETVRAKPVAVAALSDGPERPAPAAAQSRAAQEAVPEPKPAKKPVQKGARAKAKPVAEESAEPEVARAAAPEEEGFGSKLNRGIKAIGGIFGQD